jgi:hypothetical protein
MTFQPLAGIRERNSYNGSSHKHVNSVVHKNVLKCIMYVTSKIYSKTEKCHAR